MLAAIAILAVSAQALTTLNSHVVRAEREAELLFRGQAYRNAIARYVRTGPDHSLPRNLTDLLNDPRFPHQHYIRTLYPDPMTADGQWSLVRGDDGGILGVASTSRARPLRHANFPPGLEDFAGAASYADWVFQFKSPPTAPAH